MNSPPRYDTSRQPRTTGAETMTVPDNDSLSRTTWPVPQIIVECLGVTSAWGRGAFGACGYKYMFRCIRETFIPPNDHDHFDRTAQLKGNFFATHGESDQGYILLHAVGWREMLLNVVSIKVDYASPSRSYKTRWEPVNTFSPGIPL